MVMTNVTESPTSVGHGVTVHVTPLAYSFVTVPESVSVKVASALLAAVHPRDASTTARTMKRCGRRARDSVAADRALASVWCRMM